VPRPSIWWLRPIDRQGTGPCNSGKERDINKEKLTRDTNAKGVGTGVFEISLALAVSVKNPGQQK